MPKGFFYLWCFPCGRQIYALENRISLMLSVYELGTMMASIFQRKELKDHFSRFTMVDPGFWTKGGQGPVVSTVLSCL